MIISSCGDDLGWPRVVITGFGATLNGSGGGGSFCWTCWMCAGADGAVGADGADGAEGADGPDGADGADGADDPTDENLTLDNTCGTLGVTALEGADGALPPDNSQPTFLGQSQVCSSWLYIKPPVQLSCNAPPNTHT